MNQIQQYIRRIIHRIIHNDQVGLIPGMQHGSIFENQFIHHIKRIKEINHVIILIEKKHLAY